MCFLIIDLDCALASSVGSNLAHQALSQRLTHRHTQLQLSHNKSHQHLFVPRFSFYLSTLSSPSSHWATTKTLYLGKINFRELAVKINHFLYQRGNKDSPERKKNSLFRFFFSINQFPFTTFHSCRIISLIDPSGNTHFFHFHLKVTWIRNSRTKERKEKTKIKAIYWCPERW